MSQSDSSDGKKDDSTIEERLDAMPLEEFEVLLQTAAVSSANENLEPTMPEHKEILKQLKKGSLTEHDKTEADELVKSSKYSSSLQSLNPPKDLNSNPVLPPPIPSFTPDKTKGTSSGYHTSTLTTINSNSSLNSVGVDLGSIGSLEGAMVPPPQPPPVNGGYPVTTVASLRHSDEAIERLERQHYGRTYNTSPMSPPPIKSRHLSGHGQPPVYFFNERETELPNGSKSSNGYKSGCALDHSPPSHSSMTQCGGPFRRTLGYASVENQFNPLHHSNPNNSVHLPEEYNSVACLTSGGSSAPSLTRSSTPSFGQGISIAKSPSEGSNTDRSSSTRRGASDKKKAKKNSQRDKVVDLNTLPGFRGNDPVENLVQFVEGMDSSNSAKKKGNKKEDKQERTRKDKDTLVKSASLDENHLNYNTKRATPDPQTSAELSPNAAKGLKELEKKSEKAVSTNSILPPSSSSVTSPSDERKLKNESNSIVHPTTSVSVKEAKDLKRRGKEPEPPSSRREYKRPVTLSQNSYSFSGNEERKDESSEGPFELVQSKKRKPKRTKTQREAETFSRGKAREDARREGGSRSRRNGGDRRKSVGSVPGSEASDQSDDDDSVRSLPAGECTPKERVPKQCASSGGTPQTSYADIARITDGPKTSLPVPQSLSIDAECKTAPTAITPMPSPKPSSKPPLPPPKQAVVETIIPSTPHVTYCSKGTSTDEPPFKVTHGSSSATFKVPLTPQQKQLPLPTSVGVQTSPMINTTVATTKPQTLSVSSGTNTVTTATLKHNNTVQAKPPQGKKHDSSSVPQTAQENSSPSQQKPSPEGIKVSISDKTEFPDIAASISLNHTNQNHRQHPLKRNNNHQNSINNANANNNNNTNANNGSTTTARISPVIFEKKSEKNQNNNNSSSKDVWKMIHNHSNENSLLARESQQQSIIVQPVFVQSANEGPEKNNGHQLQNEEVRNEIELAPLVNGDHYQHDQGHAGQSEGNAEEGMAGINIGNSSSRRRRNSVSSSSTGGDVPVVFCGGNFERQMAVSQDIGFEFGFDVMSALSSNEPSFEKSEEECFVELPPSAQTEDISEGSDFLEQESMEEPVLEVTSNHPVPENESSTTAPKAYRQSTFNSQQHRESLLGNYRGPNSPTQNLADIRRGSQALYRQPRGGPPSYRNNQRNGDRPDYRGFSHVQYPYRPAEYYRQQAAQQAAQQASQQASQSNTSYIPPQPAGHILPGPPVGAQQFIAPPPISGAPPNQGTYVTVPSSVSTSPGGTTRTSGPNTTYILPPPVVFMNPMPVPTTMAETVMPPNPSPASMPMVYYGPDGTPMPYPPLPTHQPVPPYYYYAPPPNFAVPFPPMDVENWMNNYVQRTYNMGSQGQVNMHHID